MTTSHIQFRSISLPSRLHPINPTKYESQLQKLKSWVTTSCLSEEIPVNSETIQSNLLGLAELYNTVEKLTESPSKQDRKAIEESLEGSVDLLDACSTIQELVQMMKENIQSLQSGFRRKGVDSSIQNDMTSYFYLRKKMNKSMAKIFKKLKNLENKYPTTPTNIGSSLSVNGDPIFIRGLREVMGVTVAIFKCVLELFSWSIAKPHKGWLLVAMLTKSMATARFHHHHNHRGIIMSEVGSVDFALNSLQERIRNNVGAIKVVEFHMVQRKLQNLEFSIEGIEIGLERLFRHLLQSRVTLLNILTDQ